MKTLVKYCGLAALLAGAAFCLPSCDGDEPTAPTPYDGPWKVVPCPDGPSYLNGVFFLNPNLGYAVGCRHILKYDGTEWKIDFAYKEYSERYIVALEDVWFNAPDDGWVAGREYDTETKVSTALLLRYDGKEWKRFNHRTPATSFDALHFLSANDGWAAGFGICHWNGTSWEYISDLSFLTDIYFNSLTDGWATGHKCERIYHYDGETWTRVHDDPWGVELTSVFFVTPDHGWAGANRGVKSEAQSPLLEYKDGKWSYFPLEIRRSGINAIHFSSPNCGWAAEQYTYYYNGRRWRYVKDPVTNFITDVFTLSEYDAWAVGEGRTILHYQP